MSDHFASKAQEAILVELGRVLRTFSLYGPNHPSTQNGTQSLGKTFDDLLKDQPELEIAIQEGKILISGKTVEDKNPVMKTISDLFHRLGILSLTFHQGLTLEDLLALVKILAEATPKTKTVGKFEDILKQSPIQHVEANTAVYARVAKGQINVQTSKDKDKGGDSQKFSSAGASKMGGAGFEEVMALFKNLSGLKRSKFLAKLAAGHDVVGNLFEEGLTSQKVPQLKELLESVCNVFLQNASKAGDNPLKVLKSFDKYRRLVTEKIEGKGSTGLDEMLHETYDLLRVQIIARQYLQADQSQANLAEIAKKWVKSPDELWRLIPQVKKILMEKGLGNVPLPDLVGALGGKYVPDRKGLDSKLQQILSDESLSDDQKERVANHVMELVSDFAVAQTKKSTDDLRAANVRLIKEKQRMESVFESVSEGLVVMGKDGKIISLNQAARNLLGLGPNDPVDERLLEKLGPGHVVALPQECQGGIVGKIWETQLKGDALGKKVLRESVGVIRDENGEIAGSIFTLSDVTRQRQAIERKAELFSKTVYDMRVSLTSLKESMILLASHIQGNLPEEQKKLLEISQNGIKRLNEAIERFHQPAVSREKTQVEIRQWVDIEVLVRKTLDGMQDWISSKEVKMNLHFQEREVILQVDLDRFLDLLHTLIAFLVKLTARGGEMRIETHIPLEAPDMVEISFQSQTLVLSAQEWLDKLRASKTKEDWMMTIFNAIGMKLPQALDVLLEEGFDCKVEEQKITLSLRLPEA